MMYRRLGQSGLQISPLCLGAMMFGGAAAEDDVDRIFASARDHAVNFVDTADAYNAGASEEVVGKALKVDRDQWVLATKIANPIGPSVNQGGLSRKWLMEGTENSLRRLQTDYIDIQYLHKQDLATPLEETVRALGDLMQSGKIRYFGVSNYRAWRIAEIVRVCDQLGVARPVVNQPCYNAMNRQPEVEDIPASRYYGLGVVPYSPLARGVLTGKYAPSSEPDASTRAGRGDPRMLQTEWREESLVIAQKLKVHAESRGITAGQFAMGWVLHNRAIASAIAGPRTLAQWTEYVGALEYDFMPEDEALVDELVVTGHASTPGFNDPAYPIEGREVT
ncbi:MAG: aldo/keto reductase [Pseudomonadota bacterium]